jgi:hypothetical protein
MRPSKEELLRWKARFDEIHALDLAAARKEGPRPAWAIAVSLSMISAAEAAGTTGRTDSSRDAEGAVIQERWARLRAAYR